MYMVGSHIISTYAGMPFGAFVAERIFEPLGMHSASYTRSAETQSADLSQSWSSDERRIPYWCAAESAELIAGPGGISSNAEDMVRRARRTWHPLVRHF